MARSAMAAFALMVAVGFAGCATMARAQIHDTSYGPPAGFSAQTAPYRFYPGDAVEVSILSAPELSRTVTIGPDGRIDLPLIEPIMAADQTADELRDALLTAYSRDLRVPEIEVTPSAFGSNQIFVGGEVARPGVYEFRAPLDMLQAVTLAGGFTNASRRQQVVIVSRVPGGEREVTIVDLRDPAVREALQRTPTLRRYDVIYVPRTRISNWNLFVQQYIRDALPINFSLFYDLKGNN